VIVATTGNLLVHTDKGRVSVNLHPHLPTALRADTAIALAEQHPGVARMVDGHKRATSFRRMTLLNGGRPTNRKEVG